VRAFFAVVPDPESCLAIEQWRAQNWPTLLRPVRARNYHITLSFLGDINPVQLERIQEYLHTYSAPMIDISLDDTGYWPDNGTLWLGPSDPPAALTAMSNLCIRTANRAGIKVRKKNFSPHLTLARKVTLPPAAPLQPPLFQLRCEQLLLLQSVFDKSGVRYLDIDHW